jgi:hypothetical protein
MANTFVLIASVTVGSGGAANIEFTSIPSTYTDLLVLGSLRDNRSGAGSVQDFVKIQPNSSTTNASWRGLIGNGTSASSENNTSALRWARITGSTATASTFGNGLFYIPNYAGSNYKSISSDGVAENNATEGWQALDANLWSNSATITSLKMIPADGTLFEQYSTAYLYGISNS